jgi:hypothetical protein
MSVFALLSGKAVTANAATSAVFAETESHETGFAAHYDAEMRPLVDRFEQARIAALTTARKRLFWAVPIILAVAVGSGAFLFSLPTEDDDPIAWFLGGNGILIFLTYAWVHGPVSDYKLSIKNEIFPRILSFLGDFSFTAEPGDLIDAYERSGLIPSYDDEETEDRIAGSYNGVAIDLFETRLTKEEGSGKNRRTVVKFDGIAITLSMHKKFKGKTLVRRDKGAILNWFGDKFSKLEKVHLEDPRFEDEFEVYSDDQIEARYLLTTAFMDRLLTLRTAFAGKGLECSFYDNRLFMMIPVSENMFETGSVFEPEDFIDDAKRLLKEMATIFSIVDTLKLEQNLGL